MSNPIITKPIETRLITQGQAGIIMAQVCDLSHKGETVAEFPEITPVGYMFEYSVNNFKGDGSDGIFKMELVDEESLERFMTKYAGWNIHCYGERMAVHLTMSRKAWQMLDDMEENGITGSLYYA
tara:strand:+ start:35 stop:409 length:375 start_codon:yes stop_codon:yes gene_type:complete